MKIGEVAREAGVSISAVRYYERLGLVPEAPRTPSGYRAFDPSVVPRLRFIQRAQVLGFSLEEIRELLGLRSVPGARAAEVQRLARKKLEDVESKMADLARIHRSLLDLLRACPGAGATRECPIMDALEH